jgi:predicted nucleic acid-binding protein
LILVDDRSGDAMARSSGLMTTGTLGLLVRAAQLGLIDLNTALLRLRETSFRCRPELLEAILNRHGRSN